MTISTKNKKSIFITLLILLLIFSFGCNTIKDTQAKLTPTSAIYDGNGKMLLIKPQQQSINFTTMLPVDFLAEFWQGGLDWQEPEAILAIGDTLLTFISGQNYLTKEVAEKKQIIDLSVAPYILEGKLMVPLRTSFTALGKPIEFFGQGDNAIILGKYKDVVISETRGSYSIRYEELPITITEKELSKSGFIDRWQKNNVYSITEIWDNLGFPFYDINKLSCSYIFDYAEEDRKNLRENYFIAEEVKNSEAWQDFIQICSTAKGDLDFCFVDVYSTEDKIYGSFYANLNYVLGFAPLVFEAEFTRQSKEVPENLPIEIKEQQLTEFAWKLTKISNPRAYLNLQSLKQAEPENYNLLIISRPYLTQKLNEK